MKTIKLTSPAGHNYEFPIADDTTVTIDGEVILFESKKGNPKVGDLVKITFKSKRVLFSKLETILEEIVKYKSYLHDGKNRKAGWCYISDIVSIKILTPDQYQSEINA